MRSISRTKENDTAVFDFILNAATSSWHKRVVLAFSLAKKTIFSTIGVKRLDQLKDFELSCTTTKDIRTVTAAIRSIKFFQATPLDLSAIVISTLDKKNISKRPPTIKNPIEEETTISMTTRQSSAAFKKIEELRLTNKKKNDEARKLQEEKNKRKLDEAAEARWKHSEREQARVDLTPRNLNDILNGAEEGDPDDMECAVGDTGSQEEEQSPLKERPVSSKSSTRRQGSAKVTPPGGGLAVAVNASEQGKTASFLELFVYPYPHVILELAITLTSDKAFEEFTKALMDFLSNAQWIFCQTPRLSTRSLRSTPSTTSPRQRILPLKERFHPT